jgi:hypothetical protein
MSMKTVNGQNVRFELEGIEGDSAGPKTFTEATELGRHFSSYEPTDEQVEMVAKMDTFVSHEESFVSKYPNATLYAAIDEFDHRFDLRYRYGIANDAADNRTNIQMSVGAVSKLDLKLKTGILKLESKVAS